MENIERNHLTAPYSLKKEGLRKLNPVIKRDQKSMPNRRNRQDDKVITASRTNPVIKNTDQMQMRKMMMGGGPIGIAAKKIIKNLPKNAIRAARRGM